VTCSGDGSHQRSGSGGTSTIDPAASLGELVAERPARAPLFERLQLDYFCGGRQTLAEACNHRGLEIDTVRTALDALDAASVEREGSESKDWRRVSVAELCAHIVAVHHDGLRKALARVEALLSIVVRVHGWAQLDLRDLQKAFVGLRGELEPQLASEQSVLFPACLALERRGTAIEETLLEEHERECASVGDGLAALRVLGGDYDPQHAVCSTHRALLDALAAFELDLHQHIHEENNVLLPRVRELNARTPSHPV
jgi:regulator of cell morphogenesis and NO signaling